jgi:hypothetical protein
MLLIWRLLRSACRVEDALSRNLRFALLISEFPFVVANLFLAAKNKAPMDKDHLLLKRATLSRPSGQWNDDDFDVLADGAVVGRIFKVNAAPVGEPWMWTSLFKHHKDRTPTYGYAATRGAAMAAFAKSWRRE